MGQSVISQFICLKPLRIISFGVLNVILCCRWSKIAQHLPGRTDNEIKNYWRTRVQKHAKQLKCDVNSKQFKDTMRYLWMPRLIERIQAANTNATSTSTSTATTTAAATTSVANITTEPTYHHHLINNTDMGNGQWAAVVHGGAAGLFGAAHVTPSTYTTQETSSTGASSDSFGTQVSPNDYYNMNPDYFQSVQVGYSDSMISPSGYFNQVMDFQTMEQNNHQLWVDGGDTSENLWNVDDIWFNM